MDSYFYHLAASLALTGSTAFVLGVFVFWRKRKGSLGTIFFLWCLSIAWWSFFELVIITRHSPTDALFWGRVMQAGDIFLPVLFVHFIATLLESPLKHRALTILYMVSSVFAILGFSPLMIPAVGPRTVVPYFLTPGPFYGPMVLFFVSCVLYAQSKLFCAYRDASGQNKAKLGYFFWGSVVGYIGGCMNFLLVFDIDIPALYSYGTYAVPLFVASTSYAIMRYRLLDITVLVQQVLSVLLLMTLIAAPGFAMLTIAQNTYFGRISYPFSIILVITLLLVVIGVWRIKPSAQMAIARTLFRHRHDMYETLSEFSKSLVTILDLRSLSEEITRTLVNVLGAKTAFLYLLDHEKGAYTLCSSHGLDGGATKGPNLKVGHGLPHHLVCSQSVLVREELEHAGDPGMIRPLLNELKAQKVDVCVPLINKDRLIGFCNLGERASHRIYSDEDLELLTTLGQSAAIALDNARLYADLKRSQILMRRIDRLRSLETVAGGFAHEIRNPLTSIKTFVQLAPERKDDPEFMGHFGHVVSEDVDRIERLIQEILDYARYMEPKFADEDLNDVVASCLYFIEVKATSQAITLHKHLAGDLPRMLLDRQQIKQVLLNLFLNAMEAMAHAGGRLTVQTHRLTKPTGDAWAQIEITDSGPGIAPADLEHIFDPFYTTKHESGEREGTGLGLTIVHQIVQEHRGSIEIASQVGRGTTFWVNLPANPVALRPSKEHPEHEQAGSGHR